MRLVLMLILTCYFKFNPFIDLRSLSSGLVVTAVCGQCPSDAMPYARREGPTSFEYSS